MSGLSAREELLVSAVVFAGNAAFPGLGRTLLWPTRLGPRGFAAYVVASTLLRFALLTWTLPHLRRMAEERERATRELRERLGREPTEDEVLAHLGFGPAR